MGLYSLGGGGSIRTAPLCFYGRIKAIHDEKKYMRSQSATICVISFYTALLVIHLHRVEWLVFFFHRCAVLHVSFSSNLQYIITKKEGEEERKAPFVKTIKDALKERARVRTQHKTSETNRATLLLSNVSQSSQCQRALSKLTPELMTRTGRYF